MSVAAHDPEWAVGFEDETWWSRLALPTLSSWAEEGKPMRLLQKSVAKDDPDPKAISCYGLYLPELDDTWLRFVDGRPVSSSNDPIPLVVLREARSGWQEGVGSHLGQRFLAHKPPGEKMDRETQPRGQEERARGEDHKLPFAQEEPVAQRHRAQVGSRQEKGSRARRAARRL